MPFHEAVASWERHLIEQALKASGGNKSDAARRLQIHRRLLYEKLGQLGMLSLTQLEDSLKRLQNVKHCRQAIRAKWIRLADDGTR